MTIKELAQTTGLPISTIRYYEKKGLLIAPKRQANNYRDYDKASINRLYLIKYLSGLGMTLEDIRHFLGQLAKKQLDKDKEQLAGRPRNQFNSSWPMAKNRS